jgi:hypothetical protein
MKKHNIMMPENPHNEKSKLTLEQFIMALNPFCTYRPVLQYKGNPDKQRKKILLFARIIHLVTFATVPLAITANAVILPWKHITPLTQGDNDVKTAVILFYLFSVIAIIIGYKWSSVYRWFNQYIKFFNQFTFGDYYFELYNRHISKIGNFFVVTGMAFIIGLLTNTWYIGLPLFLLAGISLILTYPTDRRWSRWLDEEKSDDQETDN